MILVIGGLNGFVGSNTTEALLEQGVDCVVTRHKNLEVPRFLEKHIGKRVFVESADATSLDDLRRIGGKHKIDGIVNPAGGFKSADGNPLPGLKGYFDMLSSVFKVAEEWKVKRVLFSSTAGVYFGLQGGPISEDQMLPLSSPFPLIAYQKVVEIAASEFAKKTGISTVCVRLMGMFGPGQDPAAAFSFVSRVVLAAVAGKPPSSEGMFGGQQSDDGEDLLYIKDMARAIALLQLSGNLSSDVYNVCSGRLTSNRDVVEAVKEAVPGFKMDLPPGKSPDPTPIPILDTKRLKTDIGFSPTFDTRSAVRHYVQWLRAGNAK